MRVLRIAGRKAGAVRGSALRGLRRRRQSGMTVLPRVLVVLAVALPVFAQTPRTVCLDPNASDFPEASLVDFSFLHDRPTGLHGDIFSGNDGHFYFEDGSRARFWGINIAKNSVFVAQPLIDETIAAIDRAGFNLIRFHHLDDVQGLLPETTAGSSERIDPAKLALLDYWIAQCGKRGIYVYLDLLDYRTFYEAEEVKNGPALGRGAKPYAFFDPRLIVLQQQYARKLLVDHVNPYTLVSYAQDPTVCMIELCDENGLFIRMKDWQNLLSPYREQLQQRWNEWLKGRYGDTGTLAEAWTDADGNKGLAGDEKLEAGMVRLFPQPVRPGEFPSGEVEKSTRSDPEEGQVGRVADRRLFFIGLHDAYFKEMRDYLRSHGVRQPVSAVTDFTHLSDLASVAGRLDYVGINFYYDHPLWQKGNDWRLPAFFENVNPIADERVETALVPKLCAGRAYNKPIVLREWNVCWPNKFRGVGMLEAATYAALQDVDAMILFTYDVRPGQRKAEFFDVRSDPTRWGLAGQCASLFLKRQIAPARRRVAIGYSAVDTNFLTRQPFPTEIYKLGYVSQLSNLFFGDKAEKQPDLLVASGRCNGGAYPGERTIICGNWEALDLLDHERGKSADRLSGYEVATVPEKTQDFSFGGTMYDSGSPRRLTASPGYLLADVQQNANYRPIGIGADGEMCLGFRDMKRNNYVFRKLGAVNELRVALDAIGQIFDDSVTHKFVDHNRYVSDTGQVRRLVDAELLVLNAPGAQGFAGSFAKAELLKTSGLELTTPTALGALVWVSLDGKPIATSQKWSLKMVSMAVNQGEEKALHHSNAEKTTYALTALGNSPIDTLGKTSTEPTRVTLNGKPLLELYLVNGTWELTCAAGEYTLYCDTPNVKFAIPAVEGAVKFTTTAASDGKVESQQASQPLMYPAGVAMVGVRKW